MPPLEEDISVRERERTKDKTRAPQLGARARADFSNEFTGSRRPHRADATDFGGTERSGVMSPWGSHFLREGVHFLRNVVIRYCHLVTWSDVHW